MPRPVIPSPLKNLRCFDILLTQTSLNEVINLYKTNYARYYAKGVTVLRHLEEDCLSFETDVPYADASWRNRVPEHKETGIRDEDIDLYSDFVSFYNDMRLCSTHIPDFVMDLDEYAFLNQNIRSELKLMEEAERFAYQRAYRKWCLKNPSLVEEQKKRKEHLNHRSREYYIALFERDPEAREWYGGKIPDDNETCEYCIREKQIRKEESAPSPSESCMDVTVPTTQVECTVPATESQPSIAPYRHHCDICDRHYHYKFELANHLLTKEHKEKQRQCSILAFYCECCDVQCRTKVEFQNHIATRKHKKKLEGFSGFHCKECEYHTALLANFEKHLKTEKHKKRTALNPSSDSPLV